MTQEISPREEEILALVAQGKTTKEIAAELDLAESTVNWHVSNALSKLGTSTRAGAAATYVRDHEREDDVAEPNAAEDAANEEPRHDR